MGLRDAIKAGLSGTLNGTSWPLSKILPPLLQMLVWDPYRRVDDHTEYIRRAIGPYAPVRFMEEAAMLKDLREGVFGGCREYVIGTDDRPKFWEFSLETGTEGKVRLPAKKKRSIPSFKKKTRFFSP